jgi:hypothetical protein
VEHKLEAAIATGNTTAEEEARKEMKWFVRELRPRNLDRTDEKAKRAVRMAINRGIESIIGKHPSLGTHLTETIDTGSTFRYRPGKEITWKF